MNRKGKTRGLNQVGIFLENFLKQEEQNYDEKEKDFKELLRRAEIINPWFTHDNLKFCIQQWAFQLKEDALETWISKYPKSSSSKRVGLILAGNIPLVGFHDIICVVLSNHIPVIKMSSKDKEILPFLLKLWQEFSNEAFEYEFVEKLEQFDAVIATGSNNTARYLEYYFKDYPKIIRKNRTSVAVLTGDETDEQIQKLAKDLFRYFGLGCRNVTKLFLPMDFDLERLFRNFQEFSEVIHHHKYANNYDYNRAIYLLNQEQFWDNNFVLLRETQELFSPLAVINFSRYRNLADVQYFLSDSQSEIQCVVGAEIEGQNTVAFGETQNPKLDEYADGVDTMAFLTCI